MPRVFRHHPQEVEPTVPVAGEAHVVAIVPSRSVLAYGQTGKESGGGRGRGRGNTAGGPSHARVACARPSRQLQ